MILGKRVLVDAKFRILHHLRLRPPWTMYLCCRIDAHGILLLESKIDLNEGEVFLAIEYTDWQITGMTQQSLIEEDILLAE